MRSKENLGMTTSIGSDPLGTPSTETPGDTIAAGRICNKPLAAMVTVDEFCSKVGLETEKEKE
eukprot:3936471-Rhodomonas_salina.1